MLWREEKTEGVRRSAAVSMNGGYSPRRLPRSHTGPAWAALCPSSCPAQCKPPSAAHTLIPTLLTPLSDPLCAPLLPACYRLPRGKFGGRRGSAGVGGRPQEQTTSSSRWNRSRRAIMTVSMNTQTQVVLVN